MVYDYVITLKRPDYRSVDMVTQLMNVFAIAMFGYFFFLSRFTNYPYLVIILALLVTWFISFRKKLKTGYALFRLSLVLASVGWLLGPYINYWMSALYMLAALLEKQVKFPQEIGFAKEQIAFNSFPKNKKVYWNELNNLLLKDGLLTMDYKNNHLVQKEVDEDVSPLLEKEFNDFCKQQIGLPD